MMILQGFVFRCAGCQARRLSTSETRRIFSSYSVGLQARRILKLDACMVIRQHKYHRQVVVLKEKNVFEEYDNEEIPKQKEIKIRNNEKFDKFVADSAKLRQNLLTSKVLIMIFAFCMVGYIFIYTLQEDTVNDDQPKVANERMVTLYRKMPLNSLSRAWGKMMTWELPLTLREPLLGLYVWLFNVQLHEAEDCNLKNYRNLQEFFRRQLKPNARIVDQQSPVTSPADGTILHYGRVENGIVEQVKGVNYSIKGFLGPHRGDEDNSKPVKDCHYHQKMNLKPGNELHHCIIYLAPGDYHRFHSPCDWKIASRRHFPGELLSVNPGIARWVQGLFNMNERVVYSGTWEHGFFSYTAVGATNVGSIKIYFDENLETNTKRSPSTCTYHDEVFTENISMKKGDMIGEFNLGSTIVLLFEAPKNFKFNINPGQKVQYGQSIGGFEV